MGFSAIISSDIFSASPSLFLPPSSGTHSMHILVCLVVSHVSLKLYSFFFILFSLFFRLQEFYVKVYWFFFCQCKLLLSFFSEFPILIIVVQLQNTHLALFCVSLLTFSFWWNVVLIPSFISWSTVSSNSLNIFIMASFVFVNSDM